MGMKSAEQATLYPSLEPLKASAPNAYDNFPRITMREVRHSHCIRSMKY
jgi:hypothetical protein